MSNTLHTSCLLAAPCNRTLHPVQRYSNSDGITMEGDYELVPTLGHPPSCVTKCLKPIHRLTHLLHVSALCLDCMAVCCWELNKKKMVQGRVEIFWAINMISRHANVSCTRSGYIVCWKVISFWVYCVMLYYCVSFTWNKGSMLVQRPKKSELSGWQLSTRKNFPDEVVIGNQSLTPLG